MSENDLKLLYITKHNVNMSHSSDTWRRKKIVNPYERVRKYICPFTYFTLINILMYIHNLLIVEIRYLMAKKYVSGLMEKILWSSSLTIT